MNDDDRRERDALDAIGAAFKPATLEPALRETLRGRILSRIRAAEVPGTLTVRGGSAGWQPYQVLVETKLLNRDAARGRQTVLYRLHAGAELPEHPHTEDEECLVLEGEISSGDLCLRAGDFHLARAGSVHPPIRSRTGALLLITQAIAA